MKLPPLAEFNEHAEALKVMPRSLTGDGVRSTLEYLRNLFRIANPSTAIDLQTFEMPTGTQVLDWTIPDEWNLRAASLCTTGGRPIVDLQRNGLHVVGYSEAVDDEMEFAELEPHLHLHPTRPDLVPYRTSYYRRQWGFCVTRHQWEELQAAGTVRVRIDATLQPGSLTYGELRIPGSVGGRTLMVTTHVCHPWMVNDNISGMLGAIEVASRLASRPLQHDVVFLFSPGTLGPISWLAQNLNAIPFIDGGLVMTGLGDDQPLTYKRSRREGRLFDRTAEKVLRSHDESLRVRAWDPYGYDERQFCSPGFDLPIGRLTRGVHGEFPEYHTSADTVGFANPDRIEAAVTAAVDVLRSFDDIQVLRSTPGQGEPQLGTRGLYSLTGGAIDSKSIEMGYLWVLSLADGEHTAQDIADKSGIPIDGINEAVRRLQAVSLVT